MTLSPLRGSSARCTTRAKPDTARSAGAETPHAGLGLETGSQASVSNGRRRLWRCSGRALKRHEASGDREAPNSAPFPCSPQTYSTRVSRQNEAARAPSAGWAHRPSPVLGPGTSSPPASRGRRASPGSKSPCNAPPFLGPETNASGKRLRLVRHRLGINFPTYPVNVNSRKLQERGGKPGLRTCLVLRHQV